MKHTIGLLGGTGFVGRHLASRLVALGWQVRVFTRRREQHRDLLVLPTLELIEVDIYDQAQLNAQLAGCDIIVNLVGILNERGNDGKGFYKAHVTLVEKVIAACRANHISRLLHMSALNADAQQGKSHYLRTKGEGEALVHAATDLQVTSFRPSVIFGADDIFFNRFATLLSWTAYLFLLPSGHAKFAPVWVNDVVEAMIATLTNPRCYGQQYNLCGPEIYRLQELVEFTASWMKGNYRVVPLGDTLSAWFARILEFFPGKPYSRDNYLSAQVESVCRTNHLAELGITPHSLCTIMPKHFSEQAERSVAYSALREQARR